MSKNDKMTKIENNLIFTLRRNNNCTKSFLSSSLKTPWSTVSTAIKSLIDKQMVSIQFDSQKETQHSQQYGAPVILNDDYEFYVGVSVGSSCLKVVLLGFSFNILKKSLLKSESFSLFCQKLEIDEGFILYHNNDDLCKWCCETPKTIEEIRNKIRIITELICDLKSNSNYNITTITYTFSGKVDFQKQTIVESFAEKDKNGFRNTSLLSILSSTISRKLEENSIRCYIDHNVKSCTIAEKEALVKKKSIYNKPNMLFSYFSNGISLGMVFDDSLYRAETNIGGEWGQNYIGYLNSNNTYSEKPLEEIIRKDVFGLDNNDFSSKTAEELMTIINDDQNNWNKKLLVDLLGRSLYNVSNNLGIDNIVFSGKFDSIFESIEWELIQEFEKRKKTGITLIKSSYGEFSAAVGAAMSCYYIKYNIPFSWKE